MNKKIVVEVYLKVFALVSALITGFLYLIIFASSPSLNGEDLAFSNRWSSETPVERMIWIVNRSLSQINGWNARLGEQLSIFWLNVPELAFSMFALACFVLLGYLVSEISLGEKSLRDRLFYTSLALVIIVSLWPSMDVFFWKTTEAGYLQPILIYLFIIKLYKREAESFTSHSNPSFNVFLSVLMFLAGVSFENTPVVLGGVLLAFQLRYLPLHEIFRVRHVIPYVSLVAGWALLATAPSTRYRVLFFQQNLNIDGYTWSYLIENRLVDVLRKFIGSSWVLVLIFLLAILVIYVAKKDGSLIIATTVAIILNILTLLPAPYTEPRTFLLSWCLMISVILQAVRALNSNLLRIPIIGGFCFASVATLVLILPAYQDFGRQIAQRDADILRLSATEGCVSGIEISRIETHLPQRFLNNREDWIFTSLDQVSSHYGCLIIERPTK